jgi:hypothetical protein
LLLSNKHCCKTVKYIFWFFFTAILVVGCSKKSSPPLAQDDVILVRVGDLVVTAKEFSVSYETSYAPLRHGDNPRQTYLKYLVNELLLANKGYDLGLQKAHYVKSRMENRRYQDLLESFYQTYIQDRVKIPEQELHEAIKKGTVKFNLLIWPTPSLKDAEFAYEEAIKSDLDDYIDQQLIKQEVPLKNKKHFMLGWLDYLDLPPGVFEHIKDLELKTPSQPIPYGGGYAIFQVQNLEMEAITQAQLLSGPKRKNMEERLFRIKTDEIAHAVMDSILTPMNFQVQGQVLEQLSGPLYTWIQDTLPKAKPLIEHVRSADTTSKSYLKDIKTILDLPLVTFSEGSKSVADYIEYMNYYRKALIQSASPKDFQKRLIHQIGAMIKNDTFVALAAEEGFEDSLSVAQDLRLWEQKWTYELYRIKLLEDIQVTEQEMREFFTHRWRELDIPKVDSTRFDEYKSYVRGVLYYEKHMQQLDEELGRLKGEYDIYVNGEVLDTLSLNDTSKGKDITFVLRKTFTGEEYAPTVDPKWVY